MVGRRAGFIENHFNILKQYINTAARTPSGESLNVVAFKIRRRRQIPGKNMITLTNISNETSRTVLKVIQSPLPGFSGKSWWMRMQLKALLHYAIFSATCLAMVENLALQVAEVWC